MDEPRLETVTTLTPETSGCSAQTLQRRKRSSTTSEHRRTKRRGNLCYLSHSVSINNLDILESDEFGLFVARKLKLIENVRDKQFAKLQIHSILFNAQFDIMSTPPDVIHSLNLVTSHQSLNSCVLSSALNNHYHDSSTT